VRFRSWTAAGGRVCEARCSSIIRQQLRERRKTVGHIRAPRALPGSGHHFAQICPAVGTKGQGLRRSDHIRQYQAYLFGERKLAANSVAQRLGALRFFFIKTLKQAWSTEQTPYHKKVLMARHPQSGRSSQADRLCEHAVLSRPSARGKETRYVHGSSRCRAIFRRSRRAFRGLFLPCPSGGPGTRRSGGRRKIAWREFVIIALRGLARPGWLCLASFCLSSCCFRASRWC
jgi:hypothetical protein